MTIALETKVKAPEKPANERQRLDALQYLCILDTPVEERFDRLTRLAQKLFDVQIALVSLVDTERQWFKSRQGLSACETPRELSFCGHAILGNGIFEITDATQDERFADNPLVTGAPNIRFYAGAPLATADGYNLGTLCIIDDKPRELSLADRSALRDLADAVEQEINQTQLREKTRHLQKAQAELGRLSLVARQTNNGVVIINRAQQIEWVNDSFTRFTGLDVEDLRQHAFDQVLRAQGVDSMTVSHMLSRLQESQPFQYEFSYRTRSGRLEWFQVNWDPFYSDEGSHDGGHSGFIGLVSLVTREKNDAQKIRESEQKFRSLVNNIPGITYRCLLDEHWSMLFMSDQIEGLSGYPASDFIHNAVRSYASVIHPEDQGRAALTVDEALAKARDWQFEYRIVRRDGSIRWVTERGSAVRDEQGRVRYLDGFILDITEERQNEARLRALFELSPIGIALNDYETGAFIEFNDALVRPTGYTREEFVALNYWDLTPRDYEALEVLQLKNLELTGRYGPYEKEFMRKDNSRYPVLLNGMVVYEPSGRKLIWSIVEDISERKRVERMKSEFISTVSHELRTPLTAISGALGLVLGGVLGETTGRMHDLLVVAHKNSKRLHLLINDLLDMEKLVAGKMRFDLQMQPLRPLLERALKDNQIYADQYGVRLELEPDSPEVDVHVDAHRLQQVMANLLSNAAKFSPLGGVVSVSVLRKTDCVKVQVKDQGAGIPVEFQTRIFQKFAQADASDTRQKGGTGLGLAITRELVERMGGRIGFDSSPGQGTTFWFELQMSEPL